MNSDTIHAWASIADFCVKFGLIILALLCVEFFIRLALIWDNLRSERGADRICWLIVLGIPVFGTLAYIFIALKERDDRLNSSGMPPGSGLREPSPESLRWAQAKLEKELSTPAKNEEEWISRYLKNKPPESEENKSGRYIKTAIILMPLACFVIALYYLLN